MDRRRAISLLLAGGLASRVRAGVPKPVPGMQVRPLPERQAAFERAGVELARYRYGAGQQRPFVYPLVGPSGHPLTRMGHPHDPESHSHHNSVWISHQNVNGANFWEDRPMTSIIHRRILRLEDGEAEAFVETQNAWMNGETEVFQEYRRTSVRPLPQGEWVLGIDLQWEATAEVTLGQTAFGPIGVRMAKSLGVKDGGGTIRNSEGGVDEAGCFRLPARWVDYSGPVTNEVTEGIALLDHPQNPHHPVPFHVRDDGWMGASLTFPGELKLVPGTPFRLQYALYVHGGAGAPEKLNAQWEAFGRMAFREFSRPRK